MPQSLTIISSMELMPSISAWAVETVLRRDCLRAPRMPLADITLA